MCNVLQKSGRLCTSVLILCATLIVFWGGCGSKPEKRPILDQLTIETGSPVPVASDFLRAKTGLAKFSVPLTIDTAVCGTYAVHILVGETPYESQLIVQDTTPPAVQVRSLTVWAGSPVAPEDFIVSAEDISPVRLSFETPPTVDAGDQNVTILATDDNGNTARVIAALRVYEPVETLVVTKEQGFSGIRPSSFVQNCAEEDEDLFSLSVFPPTSALEKPGRYTVVVKMGEKGRLCALDVADVTPPTANPVPVSLFLGDTIAPEIFVTDIDDETDVDVAFVQPPDETLIGEQTVTVLLTDRYGNTAQYDAALTLQKDTTPPVISGSIHKKVFIGDTVTYRSGIVLTDNRDTNISLNIDSSKVNTKKEGVYPVIYTAADQSGNKTTVEGSVTVFGVSQDEVYKLADKVLDEILTDDMSQKKQARAIFDWIRRKMHYANGSVKDNPIYAAYRGFKDGRGDCYVYYSLSEVLLTRAGIDNIPIKRVDGAPTKHFWCLVNLGDGWYHFDALPHATGEQVFMFTDSEVEALTKKRGRQYYVYDKSLYPDVEP